MTEPGLTPDLLLQAYANGIFPMAETRDAEEVFWVDPEERGIFPLADFHLSRSLKRRMLKDKVRATIDADFARVLDACADREETWINAEIRALYMALHRLGHAHSLEVWSDDRLLGGVYGVTLGAAFFGESMFSHATDGSKMALVFLVDRLREAGFEVFDTQFLTPHLASLGAIEIPRVRYHQMLHRALDIPANLNALGDPAPVQLVLQRMTQMS